MLHVELYGLLWAMDYLQGKHITRFKTDCVSLIKMIESPPDWPSFPAELEYFSESFFEEFRLIYISRSANICADSLAKEVRARGVLFSHVSQIEPV